MGLSRRFQLLYPFVCKRMFKPVFVIQGGEADWWKKRGCFQFTIDNCPLLHAWLGTSRG